MRHNIVIYICVAITVIAISIVAGFIIKDNTESYSFGGSLKNPKNSRDSCICSGFGKKLCANRDALKASYLLGNTEYQNFSGNQMSLGGPQWQNTDFSLY